MRPYLIIIFIFFLSCSQTKEQKTDTIPTQEKRDISKPEPQTIVADTSFNITKFTFFIDSLYSVDHTKIDTLDFNAKQDYAIGLYCFDHNGATDMYRYQTFKFLKFKTFQQARQSFQETINLYQAFLKDSDFNKKNNRGFDLIYYIISKAGTTFILYKDIIIEHERRCNYNYKIENPREDFILTYLYKYDRPKHNYFLRSCCGCPDNKKYDIY